MHLLSSIITLCLYSARTHAADRAPHILHVVADDLGYDDLGHSGVMGNNGKSQTPNINELIDSGIALHEYYTFKVCRSVWQQQIRIFIY